MKVYQRDSLGRVINDSTLKLNDTSLVKDTVKIDYMALDSTYRLKYYRNDRKDLPYTTIKKKRESNFIAQSTAKQEQLNWIQPVSMLKLKKK